ncbi:MAG: nidogen-like domain-containing protein [Phycisphaerales bacterium]
MIRTAAALIVAAAATTAFADQSALGLLFPFDSGNTAGWTQSMSRNDDGSSSQIALGFDFCFYEQNKSAVYINNNGNISFSSPFGSFTSTGFPVSNFDMVAPFWADVDTRSTAGVDASNTNLVWHKFVDMNGDSAADTLVVTWDGVGYFSNNNRHTNTFQVAISGIRNAFGGPNGIGGLNAAFSYGNMDWTTGGASGGDADGLGGTPATVGINEGSGQNRFDQIGRFDHRGSDYNGNTLASGVDHLDNRDVFFDACAGVVPAPGALALMGLGGIAAGRRRR